MAERKSTFKDDLKSERAVNEFLQKYLYSYLVDDGIIILLILIQLWINNTKVLIQLCI